MEVNPQPVPLYKNGALDLQDFERTQNDVALSMLKKRKLNSTSPRTQAANFRSNSAETGLNYLNRPPKIAIMLAMTPNTLNKFGDTPGFDDMVNIWKCYANRHNLHFIMDTSFNGKGVYCQRYGNCAGYGKFDALKRQLPNFDWIIAIDPDMYVTPSCFHIPYHAVIADILAGEGDAHVVLRDTAYGESNNAGTFMVEEKN